MEPNVVLGIIAAVVVTTVLWCRWTVHNMRTVAKKDLQIEVERMRQQIEIENMQWREDELKKVMNKSVQASRSTIKGQLAEQLFGLLPKDICKYQLSDLKFFGQPIDYICFNGMTEFRDGSGSEDIEIVFMDIKTGNAQLSPVQKKIKSSIERGKVRWETINL